MKIYVGGLPVKTAEEELRSALLECNGVSSVTISRDRASGEGMGFAFIKMSSDQEVWPTIKRLNGREFKGQRLVALPYPSQITD